MKKMTCICGAEFYDEFCFAVHYQDCASTSENMLELARKVADMPPPANDTKSIELWATKLAADISKGRD